jgi:hypothetical protein
MRNDSTHKFKNAEEKADGSGAKKLSHSLLTFVHLFAELLLLLVGAHVGDSLELIIFV